MSTIRPVVIQPMKTVPLSQWLVLKTGTGETATVYGEANDKMTVGRTTLEHRVLVAFVVDVFIPEVDVTGKFWFVLNTKNRVVKSGNEETNLRSYLKEQNTVKLTGELSRSNQTLRKSSLERNRSIETTNNHKSSVMSR